MVFLLWDSYIVIVLLIYDGICFIVIASALMFFLPINEFRIAIRKSYDQVNALDLQNWPRVELSNEITQLPYIERVRVRIFILSRAMIDTQHLFAVYRIDGN